MHNHADGLGTHWFAFDESETNPQEEEEQRLRDEETRKNDEASSRSSANNNSISAVFVTSEVAPYSKTGGLGDVIGALPKALKSRNNEVVVVAPRYAPYEDAIDTGIVRELHVAGSTHTVRFYVAYRDDVPHVFVSHPVLERGGIYGDAPGQSYGDNDFRFALLSLAALEVPLCLPCASTLGEDVVFVANDWHASLVPVYLAARHQTEGRYANARSVLIIHNLAHAGIFSSGSFPTLGLDGEWYGAFEWKWPDGGTSLNLLKAGIGTSHRVVVVSPTYKEEVLTREFGCGLDGLMRDASGLFGERLVGIVNGIDETEWNPADDPHTPHAYDVSTFVEGKAKCKAALQQEFGLEMNADKPLVGFIGRLDYQKGVDVMMDAAPYLIEELGVQLVCLGSGDPALEARLRDVEARFKGQAVGWVGFSVPVSHRITAACDILLMPSRFEPCGLNQLYALRYGTLPVASRCGGLKDTVRRGVGWTFRPNRVSALKDAMRDAVNTYRRPRKFQGMQRRAMRRNYSWEKAASQYEAVMRDALGVTLRDSDRTRRRASRLCNEDSRARRPSLTELLRFWA